MNEWKVNNRKKFHQDDDSRNFSIIESKIERAAKKIAQL